MNTYEITVGGTYQNIKTGKVVIVKAVMECWDRGGGGTSSLHAVFNGTRNGKKFGATHFRQLVKFAADYRHFKPE